MKTRYRDFVARRQQDAASYYPVIPGCDMNELRFQRLPRLQEGDIGYNSWLMAKHALLEELEYLIVLDLDDDDIDELGNRPADSHIQLRLDEIRNTFPLDLIRI